VTAATNGRTRSPIARWLKFNAVGAMGILVQLSTFTVLAFLLHVNYLVATALAVETAILHNFIWHKNFTWADREGIEGEGSSTKLWKFNVTTGLFSLTGNVLLMRVFVGFLGVNYMLGNIVSITTCSLANFLVSDRIVFRRRTVVHE
jgi:putative flippase GtrA